MGEKGNVRVLENELIKEVTAGLALPFRGWMATGRALCSFIP